MNVLTTYRILIMPRSSFSWDTYTSESLSSSFTSSTEYGLFARVTQHESDNSMSIVNLAIVFGPTLFGQGQQAAMNGNAMLDASWQNKAVETILKHYTDIFVEEPEQA